MIGLDIPLAACILAATVAVGLLAHECSHALVLRLAAVEYDAEFFPGRTDGVLGALTSRPWAFVQPLPTGREPAWTLRLAALAPLSLTAPVLGLAAAGSLPSPVDPVASAALLGWLACALPSPQDFSVVWHAPQLLARATAEKADGSADTPHDATAAVPASRAD